MRLLRTSDLAYLSFMPNAKVTYDMIVGNMLHASFGLWGGYVAIDSAVGDALRTLPLDPDLLFQLSYGIVYPIWKTLIRAHTKITWTFQDASYLL